MTGRIKALPVVVNQLRRPTMRRSFLVSVQTWLQKVILSETVSKRRLVDGVVGTQQAEANDHITNVLLDRVVAIDRTVVLGAKFRT